MRSWERFCIPETALIQDAIRVIDEGGVQIALIVSADMKLKAIITDGDIRRGLLKAIPLDAPVTRVMNINPRVLKTGEIPGSENIQLYMREFGIRQIPIVDGQGTLCGIYLDDSLASRKNRVVLMVGGLGSRLGDLTKEMPKPLLAVGDKPILQTIIERFADQGFKDITLAVNYKADMIRDYFGDGSRYKINIDYIVESEPLGTAGALSLLSERPEQPFIVMNGDLLTPMHFGPLIDHHNASPNMGTMCVREYKFQVPFGVVKHTGAQITEIIEKPVENLFVSAGIYVLNPAALDYLKKGAHTDMPTLFRKMIADNQTIGAYALREYWIDIGQRDELDRAKDEFKAYFKPLKAVS